MENSKASNSSMNLMMILFYVWLVGVFIFGLAYQVIAWDKYDGIKFIGHVFLAAIKAFFWPIAMFF